MFGSSYFGATYFADPYFGPKTLKPTGGRRKRDKSNDSYNDIVDPYRGFEDTSFDTTGNTLAVKEGLSDIAADDMALILAIYESLD